MLSIDKSDEEESMWSDNCNVYAVETRSENLQSQDKDKTEVGKSHYKGYVKWFGYYLRKPK